VLRKSESASLTSGGEEPQRLKARQRAATLMGGEAPGGQGEVRLWAPEQRAGQSVRAESPEDLMRAFTSGTSSRPPVVVRILGPTLSAAGFAAIVLQPYEPWWVMPVLLGAVVLMGVGVVLTIRSRQIRIMAQVLPSYISTDDTGIAVVTGVTSLSLPWEDVTGLRTMGRDRLMLYSRSSGVQSISLAGFSRDDVKSLTSLIRSRANLSDKFARTPDPRMELAQTVAARLSAKNPRSRTRKLIFFRCLFRLMMRSGPLFTRPGETLASLTGGAAALPDPGEDSSSGASTESGPDVIGLR